jgi:hypothetical protein
MVTTAQRMSPSEQTYDAADVREFILAALATEPAIEKVQDLLVEHIQFGRLHPSVVRADLQTYIRDIVEAATPEDWTLITESLIGDARDALIDDDEPALAGGSR